jgi:hypothetical protein
MDTINTNVNVPNRASQALAELKARVVADRVNFNANQIDPALLARVSLEEELKRRGGGGGAAAKADFNPNFFVSYSYKIINDALRQLYEAANSALNSAPNLNQTLSQATNTVLTVFQGFTNVFAGVMTNITSFSSTLMATLANPLSTARTLMSNIAHLGTLMASAIASNLKKILYGKDDSKLDPDDELYSNQDGMFASLMNFFALNDNQGNESNGKNIKSHIDNFNKQITRWADLITLPFDNFAKRWLGRR